MMLPERAQVLMSVMQMYRSINVACFVVKSHMHPALDAMCMIYAALMDAMQLFACAWCLT